MGILNKKAQLQIQETIIAVFIFIILVILGMVFFYKVQSGSITTDFKNFQLERNSINFITLGDGPEFSCSKAGIKESCIDITKLLAFKSINSNKTYFTKFGYMNITIYQVFPKTNNIKCHINSINDCGIWEVYVNKPAQISNKIIRDTPVSLYSPIDDTYSIGVMVVEAYNV